MVKNYFSYAENEYKYFMKDYKDGRVADYMAAMGQSICERFLKHIIEQKFVPSTESELSEKQVILHTHSLNKLLKCIEKNTDVKFSSNEKSKINAINGYYFSTRYPGDDSIDVDKSDLDFCVEAMQICRNKANFPIKQSTQNNQQVQTDTNENNEIDIEL